MIVGSRIFYKQNTQHMSLAFFLRSYMDCHHEESNRFVLAGKLWHALTLLELDAETRTDGLRFRSLLGVRAHLLSGLQQRISVLCLCWDSLSEVGGFSNG